MVVESLDTEAPRECPRPLVGLRGREPVRVGPGSLGRHALIASDTVGLGSGAHLGRKRRTAMDYTYRRCEFKSNEWEELKDDGYRTVAVNRDGMALMARERQSLNSAGADASTVSNTASA